MIAMLTIIAGCDKTVPAQIMGGISANKPVLPLITGPMSTGSYQGKRIGACTDCRNNWASFRAGQIEIEEIVDINEELAPTVSFRPHHLNLIAIDLDQIGTCGVMGTASTMACLTAALGLMPLKGASAPAVSAARLRIAEETGRNAVAAAAAKRTPHVVLSRESFLNALVVLQAIGGSTNGIVHLLAILNRHPELEGKLTLKDIDEVGRTTPLIVDLKPSGDNYMTDFHNAGGMLALLNTLRPLLHLSAMTISGQTLGEILDATPFKTFAYSTSIIRPLSNPLSPSSSLVVLYGNLAPQGCVMKASASKNRLLLSHSGPAVVFRNAADLAQRIDSPDLDVTPSSVLVLQNIGPLGYPGMPEAGLIPIPRKLSREGVVDMLRISDGRMSGTAGGTIVLHISPESALPESVLGIVQDGDQIICDVDERILRLDVQQDEIERRLQKRRDALLGNEGVPLQPSVLSERATKRGYRGLYERTVNQAHEGADFDFLTASGPKSRS